MKDTSELLAEAVARPGFEDLAYLVSEVQWLERSNKMMVEQILSGRDVLMEVQHDMEGAYSPARWAELNAEAEAHRALHHPDNVLGTGMSREDLDEFLRTATPEEADKVAQKMLAALGGTAVTSDSDEAQEEDNA